MKIAFASCIDPLADKDQVVWEKMLELGPEVLILLGDNVYMDYGLGGRYPLGVSKGWSPERFLRELYKRYAEQAKIQPFLNLLENVNAVYTTWDDHDFAWNDAYGSKIDEDDTENLMSVGKSDYVPREKRLISRACHIQYRNWLNTKPIVSYPEQLDLNDILANEVDDGVHYSDETDDVRIVMIDGRYYRQNKKSGRAPDLLGSIQRDWLEGLVSDDEKIVILCSGVTLFEGGDCWENYSDINWLRGLDLGRAIFLSGDIHENNLEEHETLQRMVEVTSSGAARPGTFGGERGNFGFLDISENAVSANVFNKRGLESSTIVNF